VLKQEKANTTTAIKRDLERGKCFWTGDHTFTKSEFALPGFGGPMFMQKRSFRTLGLNTIL